MVVGVHASYYFDYFLHYLANSRNHWRVYKMKYYKYGHGKWIAVVFENNNIYVPQGTEKIIKSTARKIAERYNKGPLLFTDEELKLLFDND